jgi:hypothetical protein
VRIAVLHPHDHVPFRSQWHQLAQRDDLTLASARQCFVVRHCPQAQPDLVQGNEPAVIDHHPGPERSTDVQASNKDVLFERQFRSTPGDVLRKGKVQAIWRVYAIGQVEPRGDRAYAIQSLTVDAPADDQIQPLYGELCAIKPALLGVL